MDSGGVKRKKTEEEDDSTVLRGVQKPRVLVSGVSSSSQTLPQSQSLLQQGDVGVSVVSGLNEGLESKEVLMVLPRVDALELEDPHENKETMRNFRWTPAKDTLLMIEGTE